MKRTVLGKTPSIMTMPDPSRDHFQGDIDAPMTLLEYGDYECPYCGEVFPVVKSIQRRLGQRLCFAYRNFPLNHLHPHAKHAAEAAEAAGAQGRFWEMHELLFQNQAALEDQDLARYAASLGLDPDQLLREVRAGLYADRVREDFRHGARAGVNGTPTFFINGTPYDGSTSLEPLLAAIQDTED